LAMQLESVAAEPAAVDQIACLECDLLLDPPQLREGQRAACPRCGYHLRARPRQGFTRSLAFAVSALIWLMVANGFPFLALKASGLENVMTLPQTALALYSHGSPVVAGLVLVFIIGVPAAMMVALLGLLLPVARGQSASWLVPTARMFFALGPWSMVEVFVIGVIVSLVKLASMASVSLGVSFWAYIAFAVCFTAALSSLDRGELWSAIEQRETA